MVWALILALLLACPAYAVDASPAEDSSDTSIDYDLLADALIAASADSDSNEGDFVAVVPYEDPGDGVTTFALSGFSGSVYASTFSSSILTYFEHFVPKLSWSDHYVCFRGGQYDYYLFYGNDLSFSDSAFTGDNLEYIHLYTANSNGSGYQFSSSACGSFSLEVDSEVVFSDLGSFPMLDSEFSHFDYIVIFLLFVLLFSGLFRSIWSFVLRRGGTS